MKGKKYENNNKIIWICFIVIFFVNLVITNFFATLGFPEFIRAIKGKDFITIFCIYGVFIIVLGIITMCIFYKWCMRKYNNEILNQNYDDIDLMIINKFSKYKFIGYCILKLKLDGIIKYDAISEKGINTYNINVSNDIEKVKYYSNANMILKPIIDFLIEKQNLNDGSIITTRDIIENVNTSLDFTTENSCNYSKKHNFFSSILLIIFLVMNILIFGLGYLKFSMGLYFGKEVGKLFLMLTYILIANIVLGLICKANLEGKWIKKINAKYDNDCTQVEIDEILALDDYINQYEKNRILKKFILAKRNTFSDSNSTFFTSLFSSIVAVEIAKGLVAGSTAGGCSSCGSGCSSCGGGCGGCGD